MKRILYFFIMMLMISAAADSTDLQSAPLPSFSPIIKKVAPAVVNVKTSRTIGDNDIKNFRQFPFNEPDFDIPDQLKPFFKGQEPRIPKGYKNRGVGSGLIISKDGFILTNSHVVEHADEITVKLNDGKEYKAKVIGKDQKTDVALIKIEAASDLPVAELGDSSALEIGDWVIAIGNPFGLEHTVTAGIVSGKGRRDINPGGRQGYYDFIQTDASINPGNSGGPLIDINGLVVGINTAINATGQGIGFAIPINLAKKLIPELKSKGKVTRSWIGIRIQKVTEHLAKSFGLKKTMGALVSQVIKGGPGESAGIKNGDIILEFDGRAVIDGSDLPLMASLAGVGKNISLIIWRDGSERSLTIKLGEMPDDMDEKRILSGNEGGVNELGVRVAEVPNDLRKSLGIPQGTGVIVEDVEPGSNAQEAGLRKGNIIININDRPVTSPGVFKSIIDSVKKGGLIRMYIMITDGTMYVAFIK